MENWKDRCLTCKFWKGDKAKTLQAIAECGPVVMDMDRGWAGDGECEIKYKWAEIEITGDATATLEVPASFGCVLHEAEQGG